MNLSHANPRSALRGSPLILFKAEERQKNMIEDYAKKKNAELKKLNGLFNNIPENKKKLIAKLIDNVAHMSVVLDDLAGIVAREGAYIIATNGNGFEIPQESQAQRSYNTTFKNYTSAVKQLTELLPPDDSGNALDELRKALK